MPTAAVDRSAKPRGPRFAFLGDTISELKKVVWLSRRELVYLTILVVIVAIATGIFLGLVDLGFTTLIDKLILGR
ncbi:MAG: preprotein translocase subunit SecE [Chloroflexi bacterium]|nr:preprotein translocase subunit SecE [Chloroflexota bacterium]